MTVIVIRRIGQSINQALLPSIAFPFAFIARSHRGVCFRWQRRFTGSPVYLYEGHRDVEQSKYPLILLSVKFRENFSDEDELRQRRQLVVQCRYSYPTLLFDYTIVPARSASIVQSLPSSSETSDIGDAVSNALIETCTQSRGTGN